ncbi:MAG: hypothetical protein ACI9DJ_000570 [Algoriphagus sp.]|jgi:hypothetical protein
MRTSKIVQVEINFQYELIAMRGSSFAYSYYSNLSLACKSVENALLLNSWGNDGFNYTAVYRSLKERESYVKVFKEKGIPFFKITLSYKTLNPKLDSLELVKKPD